MSKLDDHLKDSKKAVEPRSDLSGKIMKAVYELPAHKSYGWPRLSLLWATPVAVALLAVVIIASPVGSKLDLGITSLHTTKPNINSKISTSSPNSNGNSSSGTGNTNSNPVSTNSSNDDTSLNNDLGGVNNSINENQQSLDAASTAISDQQLDTPPSD